MKIRYIIILAIITLSFATSCKNTLDAITGATKKAPKSETVKDSEK